MSEQSNETTGQKPETELSEQELENVAGGGALVDALANASGLKPQPAPSDSGSHGVKGVKVGLGHP